MSDVGDSPRRAVIRRVRVVVVALTVLLILLLCAWIVATKPSAIRMILAAFVTAPLWLCLPKLIEGHRRTCAALTLVLVPYLVVAVTEAVANPLARPWAGAVLFVAFASFVCVIGFLRVSREPPSLPARTGP